MSQDGRVFEMFCSNQTQDKSPVERLVRTFAARGADSDPVTRLEQRVRDDGVVHFLLEYEEEALLADLLTCLWASKDCPSIGAERTVVFRWHFEWWLCAQEGKSRLGDND